VDVERFDLEPQRQILHGLLGELDVALLPGMSSREKVPHMLRFLEAEQLSPRMAASVVEIDRTLSTWPQLAGDVVSGATVLAEAVRRIGLGEDLRSGRIHLDVGWLINQLDEPEMARDRPLPPAECSDPAVPGVPGVITAAAIRAPSWRPSARAETRSRCPMTFPSRGFFATTLNSTFRATSTAKRCCSTICPRSTCGAAPSSRPRRSSVGGTRREGCCYRIRSSV
jgi:hypothetical protein